MDCCNLRRIETKKISSFSVRGSVKLLVFSTSIGTLGLENLTRRLLKWLYLLSSQKNIFMHFFFEEFHVL